MKRTTKTNDGITAIYVRRSVSDKDKGNNSLSISAQKEECIRFVVNAIIVSTAMTASRAKM